MNAAVSSFEGNKLRAVHHDGFHILITTSTMTDVQVKQIIQMLC